MISLLLTGCILPVPTPANPPRFSPEQLGQLTEGLTTRDSVASTLGTPDLRRANDRFWFYHWTVDRGVWLVIPFGAPPLISEQFILVLEFDGGGVLRSKEFAGVADKSAERYCTGSDVCVEHRVVPEGPAKPHSGVGFANELQSFDDAESVVTIRGAAKDRVAWPALSDNECVLVLWPEKQDWKPKRRIPFEIGDYDGRLPVGTYAVLDLPTGGYVLRGVPNRSQLTLTRWADPSKAGPFTEVADARFECEAGQQTYMALGLSTTESAPTGFQFVLRQVEPSAAQAMIVNMPRVLPQEKTGK